MNVVLRLDPSFIKPSNWQEKNEHNSKTELPQLGLMTICGGDKHSTVFDRIDRNGNSHLGLGGEMRSPLSCNRFTLYKNSVALFTALQIINKNYFPLLEMCLGNK